ncbi:MFS transporter [Planobacterium oryzisoli]|uniref:MFS transporter n=1 Tax=Planobacterium oryzisoli TaxID=2771435 RepID=A0A930YXK9_9FLAO|nr:MFS transporter [Planobacterium oryzisoli]MBF5028098.1 MFS transporter [Planobacterium oryzisoli]
MNTNAKAQGHNYTLPIIMMFLLFFIISFVTGLQNPMAEILKGQFSLTNAQAQLANGAVFLAYLFMGVPAGRMLERIGYKKTALTALVIGFVGVLILYLAGRIESFYLYLLGAFISGFSMCLLNAVVNPMLSVLGSEEGANQRLNFGGALNSLGGTLAPVLGGLVLGNVASPRIADANPLLYLSMGIFLLVFIVLNTVKIPEPHIIEASTEKGKNSPLSFRHFIMGMVAIFLYVGVEVSISNTTLNYLINGLNFDQGAAGSIVGTYWLLMLVGRLLGGALGKTFSSKQMLTTVSLGAIAFLIISISIGTESMAQVPAFSSATLSFVMTPVPVSILLIILCGLFLSVMWPAIFNLATHGLGKYTAQGSGLFMMMVFGGGVLPYIQGYLVDRTQSYASSYWLPVVAMGYILFYALAGSKNVNKDIKVD